MLEDSNFYSNVDAASSYRTVSVMCVPIYTTSHLCSVAPHHSDKDKQLMENTYDRSAKSTSLSVVGILQLINKVEKVYAKGEMPAFIPFTKEDCVKACCMVNMSAISSNIKEMFNNNETSHGGSLNDAVENALRLDVPWPRVISKLAPIQKTLKHLRLDTLKVEQFRDPHYEPGYHYDRFRVTNRLAANTLDINIGFIRNTGKNLRFLQSSNVACVNTRASNGDTPLMKAVLYHREDVLSDLLLTGASPYLVNKQGNTALHIAAMSCKSMTLHLLIRAVCDPFAVNSAGHNPRYLCESALRRALSFNNSVHNIHRHAVEYLRNVDTENVTDDDDDEVVKIAMDRLQALSTAKHFSSEMFPTTIVGREIVDLCKQFKDALTCRKMLLAAEATWLRVLNRGFINTWDTTNVPLPPAPTNVIQKDITKHSVMWSETSFFVGWDAGVSSVSDLPATQAFEVIASPPLQTTPTIIQRQAAEETATSQRTRRQFAFVATNLLQGVEYRFKIVAINSSGGSAESSWSLPKKKHSGQYEYDSGALLHHNDSRHSQHQKCMYWEGLLSLTELKSSLNKYPWEQKQNEASPNAKHPNHHLTQWDTSKQDLLDSFKLRGATLRHLASIRHNSDEERRRRLNGSALTMWSLRNFSPFDDAEASMHRRIVNSASQNADGKQKQKGVNEAAGHIGKLEAGYTGLETCKFHVCCSDVSSVTHINADLQPLKVARGNPGISFVFNFDGMRAAKIRKTKANRQNLWIQISAFSPNVEDLPLKFQDTAARYSFRRPIHSTSIVVTRGRSDLFGNMVVTVLCPPEVLSLANVNYYVTLPQGAFQIGTADPRSPWFDSPKIVRCVQTNDCQVLWDRCGPIPKDSRKLMWRELQLAYASVIISPPKVEKGGTTKEEKTAKKKAVEKLEDLGRPIFQTHTPPKVLLPPISPETLLILPSREEEKETEVCQTCKHHTEPNSVFSMQVASDFTSQCWHPTKERCELCGHEWTPEKDETSAATEAEKEAEHAEMQAKVEAEKEFLVGPSLTAEHFFLDVEHSQRLRYSPHMLNEDPSFNTTSQKLDPELWTENIISESVLLYFSKKVGPLLIREAESVDSEENKSWQSVDRRQIDSEENETTQQEYRLPTNAHEMVHVDVPGEHLLSPQARVIRNQILMTMRDL